MTQMTRARHAVSLAEIVITLALVAIVSVPLFGLLGATDHEAMTSEDYMQAEAIAQRHLADALAMPWAELEAALSPAPESRWKLDLTHGGPGDAALAAHHEEYGRFLKQVEGQLTATKVEDGLIALEVQLAWPVRPGSPARRRFGLVRMRARPDLSIRAVYPFGDGEGNK